MSTRELTLLMRLRDEASQALGGVMGTVDRFKVPLIAAGAAMAGVGAASIKMAADFETPMRNVNTMLKLNESEFQNMQKDVLEISRTVPQSAETLAAGMYQVVSAGVPAEAAMETLGVAAKGASAGVATTEQAMSAIIPVIKGMGMEWTDSSEVMDKLFKTVELGVTTFPELAGSIGVVIPMAHAAGVSLDEVLGATAALTGVTGGTSEVMTQLRGVLAAILTPTKDMETALAAMGYESGQAMLQSLGFSGTLQKMTEYSQGNTAQLGKMFGRVEALNAVLALGGPQAASFAEKTLAMAVASEGAGATMAALEEQQKGFNFQAQIQINNLKAMAIGMAKDWLPALSQVSMVLPTVVGAVGGLGTLLRAGTIAQIAHTVATGAHTVATTAMTAAQWLLNAALSANPIGIVVLALAAMAAAIIYLWNNSEEFRTAIEGLFAVMQAAATGVLVAFQAAIQAVGDVMGTLGATVAPILQTALDSLTALVTFWIDLFLFPYRLAWEGVKEIFAFFGIDIEDLLRDGLNRLIDLARGWLDRFTAPFRQAWEDIKGLFGWMIGQSVIPDMVEEGLGRMLSMAQNFGSDFAGAMGDAAQMAADAFGAGMGGMGWPSAPKLSDEAMADIMVAKLGIKKEDHPDWTNLQRVQDWATWKTPEGKSVLEGFGSWQEFAAGKGWLPKAPEGPRISPSSKAMMGLFESFRPFATSDEQAVTDAVNAMYAEIVKISGGKITPTAADMQRWWNNLMGQVIQNRLDTAFGGGLGAGAGISGPSLSAPTVRPTSTATPLIGSITLQGIFLAPTSTIAEELARILKPKLDALVMAGV